MNNESRILQQWIQIIPIERRIRQQPLERVGGQQREGEETNGDKPHHAEYSSDHDERQTAAKKCDRRHPARQNEHPEEQGALVITPHRGKLEYRGQQTVGVRGNNRHREIVGKKTGR